MIVGERAAKTAKRIGRGLLAACAVVLGVVAVWGVTGSVMAAQGWSDPPRGAFVEVDGRRQRIVCMGEARPGVPTVVFEAGAYSGAADFGFLQPEIAKGGATCSYDRAGIGWSEPAAGPRDPGAIARDLEALLTAANVEGPYVLVGHSMAGLMLRAYVADHPDKVVGLVLIDAADPAAVAVPEAAVWIARFQRLARLGATASRFGLVKPLSPFFANRIGLSGPALEEKRRMFGARRHLETAAAEIGQTTAADLPRLMAVDARLAQIPVATVIAGPREETGWQTAQRRASTLSPKGFSINVDGANHTTILGPVHGRATLDAIERVRREAAAGA